MPLGEPGVPSSGPPHPSRPAESEFEDAENVAPRPSDETASTSGQRLQQQSVTSKHSSSTPLSENSLHAAASSSASKAPPASKTKLKVTVRNWNGVATWKWIANDDTCGICRVAFDGCCPDCKLPGDDCPVVWGACTHCFHIHCIMKWINQEQAQQLCPMCRQEWKFKE